MPITQPDPIHVGMDINQFWLRLPYPPSTNNLYYNVRGVGRVKTKAYRAWCKEAGWMIREQRPPKCATRYILDIVVERPKRRRDLSNMIKAVEDLLVDMQITPDDSHCDGVVIVWADQAEAEIISVRLCDEP